MSQLTGVTDQVPSRQVASRASDSDARQKCVVGHETLRNPIQWLPISSDAGTTDVGTTTTCRSTTAPARTGRRPCTRSPSGTRRPAVSPGTALAVVPSDHRSGAPVASVRATSD